MPVCNFQIDRAPQTETGCGLEAPERGSGPGVPLPSLSGDAAEVGAGPWSSAPSSGLYFSSWDVCPLPVASYSPLCQPASLVVLGWQVANGTRPWSEVMSKQPPIPGVSS